jgi:hypothetical protein
MDVFDLEPKFITLLADRDHIARYTGTMETYDIGGKKVQFLVTIFDDGELTIATRPTRDSTWSPPQTLERSVS